MILSQDEWSAVIDFLDKYRAEKSTNKTKYWPQEGDEIFYIDIDGEVCRDLCYHETDFYKGIKTFGNMFKTEEQAEFKLEQLKVLHELEELTDDDQPKDGIHIHYTLMYNVKRNQIFPTHYYEFTSSPVSFKSEESALAAIDKIGADRLKKYYFGIGE